VRFIVSVYYNADDLQDGINGNTANGYKIHSIVGLVYSETINDTINTGTQYTVIFEQINTASL
jgi:hypothetical protein